MHKWGRQEILALHRLSTVAVRRLDELVAEAGGTVSLIGHSLGGIYAREVARAAPDRVRRVITVGSPFAGDLKSNVVWPMYEAVTGTRINSIPKEVMARMNHPLPVPSTAIYSRSDGVVAWRSCIDVDAAMAENVEVQGSHIGLLHNPAVLYVIADRLAQPEGDHRPFEPSGWKRLLASTVRPRDGGELMARMSRMDAAFLAMERPNEPRHLGSLVIFGPGRDGPLTYDVVRRRRRRPARRAVGPASRRRGAVRPGSPVMGDRPGVRLEYHVRQAAIPPDGGDEALARFVGDAHALPLDRSRPLWELWVIEGLEVVALPCTPRSTWRRSTTRRAPS